MAELPRVLLIDDDPGYGPMVRRALEKHGFTPIMASSGHEGLGRIKDSKPCLILLDIYMKGLDGIMLHKALRSSPATKTIPIILITGQSVLDSMLEATAAGIGAEPVFRKGDGLDVLLERIRQALSAPPCPASSDRVLRRGGVAIDLAHRELRVEGHLPRRLHSRRFDVLCTLMRNHGPLSRRELFRCIWRDGESINNVDVTISRLRQDLKSYSFIRIESTADGYELNIDDLPGYFSEETSSRNTL